MRIVEGASEARETLLKRIALEEPELPPAVLETNRRVFGAELGAEEVVDRILRDVRTDGDAAVRRYNEDLDGVRAPDVPLEVSADEIKQAYDEVEGPLVEALRFAADRIRAFHERQLAHATKSFMQDGLGQSVRPIRRVGLYVPGNVVIYPSTVLMTAVPARVAGVEELIVATPARADGSVAPLKLVAADIAGASRVFRAGGAQGIAAMAYGTDSIPAVDKICGPGNIFVTIAKKKLFGEVGIDGIFGPSETLVVADTSADPRLVAADMLAGAEHDELATAVLITDSAELADNVAEIVESEIGSLARAESARIAMDARGGAVVVASLDEAIELASEFAAEHVCLHVRDADRYIDRIRNGGCIFAGDFSVESIGDYTAGPSHVMPTGGSARFASPLGVNDFLKITSIVNINREAASDIGPAGAAIARAEGLTGHARSIESRMPGPSGEDA
ncbi:MAG TPA: histidinol dehydrogenase [Dehalococcoidia bacterium]|nr:histidinol dehydrogenase [Dehalococcoidia bacterium]